MISKNERTCALAAEDRTCQQCHACHCDDGHAATFGKPRFTVFSCTSRALNNEGACKRTQHVVISFDIGAVDSQLNHQEQDELSGQGIEAFNNVKNTPTQNTWLNEDSKQFATMALMSVTFNFGKAHNQSKNESLHE